MEVYIYNINTDKYFYHNCMHYYLQNIVNFTNLSFITHYFTTFQHNVIKHEVFCYSINFNNSFVLFFDLKNHRYYYIYLMVCYSLIIY